jgi:tetratricopeptide (TPR) repeat protein
MTVVVNTLAAHSFEWERRTLLVIDYAAQCYQALARWLDRLSYKKLDHRLRFLLLDREAPEAFGWWHELTVLGPPRRRDLFHALRPRQLPDFSDREERRALVSAALQAAQKLRPEATPDRAIPAMDEEPEFDRRLAEPQFGNPLNLVMAGLIALDRGPQAALALRRLDAARHIARRELRRLTDLARSRQVGDDEMRHVIAFNGLAGGLPMAELRKTVANELAASRRSADQLGALLSLLQQELPPRSEGAQNPRLATHQPDLIGEAVIIEALTGDPVREAEAAEVVSRAYALGGQVAAEALVHLVQDFAHALEDTNAPEEEKATGRQILGWLLSLAPKIEDPEELIPFADALPDQTTILRELAAELTQRLATYFLREAEQSGDPAPHVNAAVSLNNLAARLSALGQHEEALNAAEEAVRLYRVLAEARPNAFIPDLARSLNNLANMLSILGRREEALTAAEEAVCLRRHLAEARPDVFIPDLALSLNNLAPMLRDLGRPEGALTVAEEAVRPAALLPRRAPTPSSPTWPARSTTSSRAERSGPPRIRADRGRRSGPPAPRSR